MVSPRCIHALLLLAGGALATLAAPAAHASDCGNVTEDGVCLDTKTLHWCDDGVIKQMVCPAGEVCVAHANFGGGHGCIGTAYTGCGDVTAAGECITDTQLIWCDADQVRERDCAQGSVCDWVVDGDDGWYDCVPDSGMAVGGGPDADATEAPEAVEPPETDPNDVVDTPPVEMERVGPVPRVQQGGAGPAGDLAGGGGAGCAASPGDPLVPLSLLICLWALARRWARRAPPRPARRRSA